MSAIARGRVGRTRKVDQKQRTSFKWTPEIQLQIAIYLRDHYAAYKTALSSSRKINFLREMRDALEIPVDDVKMKNGFINFMKKFDEVKVKLNSSGFGIDPEKDATLQKGWILKVCPYYEILDEVLGCRPNVTPPAVVSTSEFSNVNVENIHQNMECSVVQDDFEDELPDIDPEIATNDLTENRRTEERPHDEPEIVSMDAKTKECSSELKNIVKDAFRGLRTSKGDANPKSAVGIYSQIMSEKLKESSQIEREKLQQSQLHFSEDIKVQNERNRIELLKVTQHTEMEQKRIDLEAQRLADKAADREHELTKLKMEHEFELKRLELQLKLKSN